jgi:hypothetical protein
VSRFAEGTTVSPERSAAEIQQLLTRFGATAFAQGWTTGAIAIEFVARDRQIRVTVPRVGAARGRPSHCSICDTTSSETKYEWANLTGNYQDVNDYARMCVTCHRRFDAARRKATA